MYAKVYNLKFPGLSEAKVAATPDDSFAWGSTTKPMTSVLILQLVDQGIINLGQS